MDTLSQKMTLTFQNSHIPIDLKKSQTITNKQMATKSGWTPYDGKKVTGWPIMTIVNGSLVMKNGKVIGDPIGKPIIFERE